MIKIFLTFAIILISYYASAQEFVLIKFADKPSAATYLSNPTSMLSQKAIDRRAKYNIPITEQDAPVEQSYIDQTLALGIQPTVISKWFNGIFAELNSTQISQVESLPFVAEVESFVRNTTQPLILHKSDYNTSVENAYNFNYGITTGQITQLNLNHLHDLGYTGEGIAIAVIDAGFPGVDTVDGFAYLRNNNQIKGGYNFVDNNEHIYTRSSHGTVVLSTIGGYIENQYIGTAIDADFYLYISEKFEEEIPQEEAWWIAAAEQADYVGVDVINTSLGYNTFDDWRYNYDYSDMNGHTTFISRGAQIATEKGIMVVVSAGNSGNSEWHYITAPADVKNVLTIGAVDQFGNPAGFSSYGPTSDGRVKPDVSARGVQTYTINPIGDISTSSGTSLSSPVMAGAMACFIQAFPTNMPEVLREQVRKSASLYPNYTDQMGYGIPDFFKAFEQMSIPEAIIDYPISVYPNPTNGLLNITPSEKIKQIEVISIKGKLLQSANDQFDTLNLGALPSGVYILKIKTINGKIEHKKIIKR